jgi:hypothetical protein
MEEEYYTSVKKKNKHDFCIIKFLKNNFIYTKIIIIIIISNNSDKKVKICK